MSSTTVKQRIVDGRLRLGVFGLLGLGFLALSLPAVLEPMTFWTGIVLGDYAYPIHELHHLVLGSVFPILLLGVLIQAYRPSERVGALHTSLIIWASLVLTFTVGGQFSPIQVVLLGLLVGMAVTHPAGRDQFPSFEAVSRPMLAVAAVTATGAIALAGIELLSHFGANDAHVAFDHYLFMATTGLSIAALAVYGSLRGVGWRFPVYSAGFLLTVIGAGSIVYPGAEQGSSLGVALGFVVVLWAVLFVGLIERGDELFERL